MSFPKFFRDDNSFSLLRLLSFLTVITGLAISLSVLIFVLIKIDISYIREIIFLVGVLLGFGFGGKVVQKFAEEKNDLNIEMDARNNDGKQ
jgi:hypothetical protein